MDEVGDVHVVIRWDGSDKGAREDSVYGGKGSSEGGIR